MAKGKFFVIEGVDGSGKSTQMRMLEEKLASLSIPSWFTAEPTERPVGLMIRSVLEKKLKVSSATLAALFFGRSPGPFRESRKRNSANPGCRHTCGF